MNKRAVFTVLALFLATLPSALQAQQVPAIGALLSAVSADSLLSYTGQLERASGYYSRVAYTPGNDSSVQYILRAFRRSPGVTRTALDTFTVPEAQAPFNTRVLSNVYGVIKGKKDSMTAVVIGAHLDTYAGRESTWASQWQTIRAPGADDNGSGVSAVMETARIFGGASLYGYSNDYTIIVAAFNAEEAGRAYPVYLYGSSHFAARLKKEGYTVRAMINIDMIGYNTALTSDVVSDERSRPIGETAVAVNTQYGLGLAMNAPPFVFATYSDHSSFWRESYPAILLIEHAPPNASAQNYTANILYHSSHDTVGALNPVLMQKNTQLAIGTAAILASALAASGVTKIEEHAPSAFALTQNYPNPFNPSTMLRFTVARRAQIDLTVVDVLGRLVAHLVSREMEPGTYEAEWNASDLPSGVYIAVLRAAERGPEPRRVFLSTKKLLMQK
ncbi:MAG: M28 family peptidase [Acidobacteriota bacterium]